MHKHSTHGHFETRAIHAGQHPDPQTGAVMTPVYLTSTYAQTAPGQPIGGYEYRARNNLTRTALQDNLASLRKRSLWPVLLVGPRRDQRAARSPGAR
ncbi:MAG: PLP-dependent transferase [Planctomycetota bacterium]